MSRTIDDKVVEMQFDNDQFERGVKESLSTLDRLKQALDMTAVSESIEKVQVKFSAFDAMVKRVFENIADNAYNTGKKLIKSLSVDQISVGWSKFGDKTEAVQTIMSATSQTWEDSANTLERANALMEKGLDSEQAKKFAARYQEVANGVTSVKKAAKELGVTPEYFKKVTKGLDQVTYSAEHTGGQMDYVSDQLAKLNWFTDETSYSFMDMVNNIGKFTANNIPLEQAVTSMQGISTWAALSGANVGEAGRAMYNLSQAISVGAVKLMDWKSIENANMATSEFKQMAIQTAVELGTLKDKGNGAYETLKGNEVTVKNFNSALSDAWFSSEVLLSTLDKYGGFAEQMNQAADATGLTAKMLLDYTHAMKDGTFDIEEALATVHEQEEYAEVTAEDLTAIIQGLATDSNELGMRAFEAAQSAKTLNDVINYVKEAVSTGWMNTFESIFGNYEEAKKLWSDLAEEMYDIFVESGDKRNEMLRAWKELGGRNDLVEAFWNVFHAIKDIIATVKDAFREIFPAMTAERLKTITEKLRDFSRLIGITDEETGELNERGEKIKTTFKGVFAVLKTLKDIALAVLKPVKSLFSGVGGGLLDFSARIGEILLKYSTLIQESGVLEQISERLGGAFKSVRDFLGNMLELFRGVSFWEGGGGIAGVFESIFDGINNAVRLFFDVFSSLTGKDLSVVRDKIMDTIRKVRNFIVDGLGPVSDILTKIKDKISGAFQAVKDSFGGFKKVDMSGPSEFKSKTEKIFGPIKNLFEGLKNIFSAVWEGIKKIAPLISSAVSLLGKVLSKIGTTLADTIKNADASNLLDIVNSASFAAIGIGIAKFINQIKAGAEAFKSASEVFGSIKGFLDGIKESYAKDKQANTLLKIAGAVAILALSAIMLSSVDPGKLTRSIAALAALFTELTIAMDYLSKMDTKGLKKGSTMIIALSLAVLILSAAVKKLSALSWEEIAKGVVGVTVLLGEMVAAAKLLSGKHTSKMMKGAANAVIFAAAIYVLGLAVKSISSMSWEELAKGLVGVTVLVGEMVAAAKIISAGKSDKMMKGALNVVIFAAAIKVLVSSVKDLAFMDTDALIQGMIGITVLIGEMIAACKIITSGENGSEKMMKGAANVLIFAAALRVLIPAVKTIGQMDPEALKQGLLGLAGILAEMVVSAKIMDGAKAGGMIAAAAALVILGAAMKIIATLSWEDIAKGLVAFAGFLLIIGGVAAILTPVVPVILALAGAMALIGVASIAFGVGLLAISAALTAFSVTGELAFAALIKGIEALITAIPDLVAALAKSLSNSISSLAELVITVGRSLLEAIKELVPDAVDIVIDVILSVLRSIAANIRPIVEALLDIVVGAIEGLAVGIPEIISATADLIKEIFDVLFDAFGKVSLTDILEATAMLVELDAMMVLIIALAGEAVLATAPLPLVGENLSDFIKTAKPFLKEIKKMDPRSLEGAAALGDMILSLTGAHILDALTSWFTGGNSLTKFGQELADFGPYLAKYGDSIKGIRGNDIKRSAEAAKSLTEFAASIPNTGGLVAKITGDNSLYRFALELSKFGPVFHDYYLSVRDIKPDVIMITSYAARSITKMADGIPKRGGFVSLITGENSLYNFAVELEKFGPVFSEYSKSMENVKPEVISATSTAAETITKMAEGIPKRGGFVSMITGENSLFTFAMELAAFGPEFAKYAESMASISDIDAVAQSSAAAETIARFAAIIPPSGGLVQLVTGKNDLGKFGAALKIFGPAMRAYANSMSGLSFEDVEVSASAASTIAKVAAELPKTGGIEQWFTGNTSLASFGLALKAFGPSFADFVASIQDIKGLGAVNASAAVISTMAKVASELPEQKNDISAWLTGDASLSRFGEELVKFGPDFASYAEKVGGIDLNDIRHSAFGLGFIAKAAAELPTQGGIKEWWTGSASLSVFGEELASFGPNFKKYAASVGGIETTTLLGSSESLKLVAEAAATLPKHDGIEQWWTGDATLTTFGEELDKFGGYFAQYVRKVSLLSLDKYDAATAAIKTMVEITKMLEPTGGIVQWWSGEYSLSDFGSSLAEFGEYFRLFGDRLWDTKLWVIESASSTLKTVFSVLPEDYAQTENLIDLGTDLVAFANDLQTFAEHLYAMGKELPGYSTVITGVINDIAEIVEQLLSTDVSGLSNYSEALAGVAENMYGKFSGVFTEKKMDLEVVGRSFANTIVVEALKKVGDYQEAGRAVMRSFDTGIKEIEFIPDIDYALRNCVSYIRGYYGQFRKAGEYLISGFNNGMTGKTSSVESAGNTVGAAAIKGLNNAIQAKSPSKKAYESGMYVIMGFSNALIAGISSVMETAALVGESAIDELSNSISEMSEIAAEDINTSPVIRPVLDLSDIQAGTHDIDAMFSKRQAYSISTDGDPDYHNGFSGQRGFVQFNQYNYSPKALNPIEIYRRTNNQLSQYK